MSDLFLPIPSDILWSDHSSLPSSPSPAPLGPTNMNQPIFDFVSDENTSPTMLSSSGLAPDNSYGRYYAPSPSLMRVDALRSGNSQSQMLQVIRSASESTLVQSGNAAFQKVIRRNLQLETELETTQKLHAALLNKVNERAILPPASNTPDSSIHGLPPPIKFMALKRNDYPLVTIWTVKDWQKHPKNRANKNTDAGIQKSTKMTEDSDESVSVDSLFYIQDAEGRSIDKTRAKQLGNTARSVWRSLKKVGMAPESYLEMSVPALHYFRQVMYADFPELNFGQDNWKLDRFGKDVYPNWYRKFKTVKEEQVPVKVEGEQQSIAVVHTTFADTAMDGEHSKKRRELSPAPPSSEGRPEKRARPEIEPNTTASEGGAGPAANSLPTERSSPRPGNVQPAPVNADIRQALNALSTKHPLLNTPKVSSPLAQPTQSADTSVPTNPMGEEMGVGGQEKDEVTPDEAVPPVATELQTAPSTIQDGGALVPDPATAEDAATADIVPAAGLLTTPARTDVHEMPGAPITKRIKDAFKFDPKNCVAWNLFGADYAAKNPGVTLTKMQVKEKYDGLCAEDQQVWKERRAAELKRRKAATTN